MTNDNLLTIFFYVSMGIVLMISICFFIKALVATIKSQKEIDQIIKETKERVERGRKKNEQ